MAFDEFWEKEHSTRSWGKYPNEMLVRFLLGNYKNPDERKKINVLETGCGGGANLWFAAREGFNAYGFDASPSAVNNAKAYLESEKVKAEIIQVDATNMDSVFSGTEFDVIFDICTLTHLKLVESAEVVKQAAKRLKKGGKFFSITFAKGSWGDGMGQETAKNCYANIPEGPFKGINVVQLMSLEDIQKWGENFSSYNIEESSYTLQTRKQALKYYILTAQR